LHRVPTIPLHLVHDLTLELRCQSLTSAALTRGLDRHVEDQLAVLTTAPPHKPELVGYVPCPTEPHHGFLHRAPRSAYAPGRGPFPSLCTATRWISRIWLVAGHGRGDVRTDRAEAAAAARPLTLPGCAGRRPSTTQGCTPPENGGCRAFAERRRPSSIQA